MRSDGFTLYTFGDSILDCGGYNARGLTPGGLIVDNDDHLFPEFRGRDLSARGPARLVHRAVDGATVDDLRVQALGLTAPDGPAAALVTVGGNDLLAGLIEDSVQDQTRGIESFARALAAFVQALPVRPVIFGNVYDPTLGDDATNFLPVAPSEARAALGRINAAIADVAAGVEGNLGRLVDLHAHFLTGDPSWFVQIIEPSLTGASEIRRAFLPAVLSV